MFKNVYFRLGLISTLTAVALLVVLPKTPVKIDTVIFGKEIKKDFAVGGYNLNYFNGKISLDLSKLKRGLDLEGGVRVVLKAKMESIAEVDRDNALESVKEIISRRVNLLGVSEPYIASVKNGDDYRVIVELPGVEDVATAINLIGQTAQLHFKELAPGIVWDESKFQELFFNPQAWVDGGVTGADLKGVDVVFNGDTQKNINSAPQIQLKFTDLGREKFSELAKRNINKPIGLFLDESSFPLSTPVVSPDLAKGLINDPVISGNFDVATAKNLSVQLRAGALPVPVEVLEQKTIGATLGAESVKSSIYAGAVGLFLVMVFLIIMYGRLGILANVALIIYALLVLSIFKIVPVVLTLPGVAGFILSVGMAADANILIFERIKEEVLWGRPHSIAIRLGFERAWSSIRDSNITSLITSAILFHFGNGPVRGFALTLAIGIVVSLFTSIYVTKNFIVAFDIASTLEKSGKVSKGLSTIRSFLTKKGNK
ncbi:protein translocase subunit SecD [candidate division WWE3 bacterium]|nr:protein translocase subunit SecD [candidate division WWE3 bacterium]